MSRFSLEELEDYVEVDYLKKPEELILEANLDSVNVCLKDLSLKIGEEGKKKVVFRFFPWDDYLPLNLAVLEVFYRSNFHLADHRELFLFAKHFPEAQRDFNIVSVHPLKCEKSLDISETLDPGFFNKKLAWLMKTFPKIPCLFTKQDQRCFDFLYSCFEIPNRKCVILGIRYEK